MQAISSNPEASTVIKPALGIAGLVTLLMLMAVYGTYLSAVSVELKYPVILLIVVYGGLCVRRLLINRVTELQWTDGELLLRGNQCTEEVQHYYPMGGSFVSPAYLGLKLRSTSGQQRSLGLFRDQVNAEFWRQSMIHLRSLQDD